MMPENMYQSRIKSSQNQNQQDLEEHIDGFVQHCSNSIANVLELLQSCTKLSTCLTL